MLTACAVYVVFQNLSRHPINAELAVRRQPLIRTPHNLLSTRRECSRIRHPMCLASRRGRRSRRCQSSVQGRVVDMVCAAENKRQCMNPGPAFVTLAASKPTHADLVTRTGHASLRGSHR